MRIALVPHAYPPSVGGAQTYARGLAEALARRGHEVHALVPDVADPEAFYAPRYSSAGETDAIRGGVAIRYLRTLGPGYRWARVLGSRRAVAAGRRRHRASLRNALAEVDPDVVIALPHLFPNVVAAAGLHPGSRWRLIYAPMLHEHDPNWSVPAVTAVVEGADAAIALTDHERDRLIDAYGARQVVVAPPGVDAPPHADPGGRSPEFVMVGRRAGSKRLEVAATAIAEVRRSHPEARLVIAGPAASGVAPSGPGVVVVDDPAPELRAELLGRARGLLVTSTVESFGIGVLEAWAHATPVVMADTAVSRSVVRHGVDGLLVEPESPAVAAAMRELLDDTAAAERMGEAGRQRVVAEFTWDRAAEVVDRIIASW